MQEILRYKLSYIIFQSRGVYDRNLISHSNHKSSYSGCQAVNTLLQISEKRIFDSQVATNQIHVIDGQAFAKLRHNKKTGGY